MRGKRKTGWIQGLSLLYAEGGFFEWKSVRPWLSAVVKSVYRPGRIRRPEDKHDAEVELELLNLQGEGRPLASYRSHYASPPAIPRDPPYIYCAAEAGWQARQLTDQQWAGIIGDLLQAFPKHTIVVHGAVGAVKEFASEARVVAYGQRSVQEFFDKVSAAELVIAPDSFALHLASFYDVPAIGYFGPALSPPLPAHQPPQQQPLPSAGVFSLPAATRQHALPQGADAMQFARGHEAG